MSHQIITAPVAGAVVPIAEIADEVFSSGALGQGAGITPEAPIVVAPAAGDLITVMPHAYGIRTAGGADVLVHIGIDTVELEGQHFDSQVAAGQQVEAGGILAVVDFDALRAASYDPTVIVVVTNTAAFTGVDATAAARVDAGDPLLTVDV